jgi:SNF2 family DNA or RNA helicase
LIELTDEYIEGAKARAVPGAFWDREDRAWVLRDPKLAAEHPELIELRSQLSQEVRPFDQATRFNDPIRAWNVRVRLRREGHDLYNFQAIDLGYVASVLNRHGGAYLGWERGLGKTVGAAALIDELACERVLVVCPNTAKRAVWEPELRRLCPWLEVVSLRNTKAQRDKDLGYVQQLVKSDMTFALIVHYEALAIIAGSGRGWDKLGIWDLIVADEAHRISNPKTKMARALKKIRAKRKLAMSGSIIQNHAEELFSPLQWLFPNHYRSKWRDWNDRFLDYVDSGYSRICVGVKIERLDEMRDELGRFMVYRRKEDELDLPTRTEQTLFVDLSPSQRRVYEDLQQTCLASLEDGTLVKAQDGLVLLTRLRQVATGLDLLSSVVTDSSKQDLATELIQDNVDEAFVVFSWYKAAAYSLAQRLESLGIGTFVVTGDTPPNERARQIAEFQAGAGRVFIGTLSTLGESVTLHRASNAIFLDRSWNPGVNAQAADRIYRIGQQRPVTITYIVAKNTVDELRVLPVVREKDDLRRLILGG